MAFEVGDKVADYEIVGLLGAGAVAEVYKVKHRVTGRLEAMKVLHRRGLAARQVDRFLREIKLQAALSHPNIAAVRTAHEINGELLMIMEYVDGQSLRAMLEGHEIEPAQVLDYALQALAALEYAHERGITHRDVTPSNMLITAEGKLKLTDFGLAKAAGDPTLTQTGTPLGSLYYMSPEHVRGLGEADQQSDIYSLGAVLYELITGRPPFGGQNAFEVMRAQVEEEPRPPRDLVSALDGDLNDTVLRALAKNPRDRFESAGEFRAAVARASKALKQPWTREARGVVDAEAGESQADASQPAAEAAPLESPAKQPLAGALRRWWAPALGAGIAAVVILFMIWPREAEQPPVDAVVDTLATASSSPATGMGAGSQLSRSEENGGRPPENTGVQTSDRGTNDAANQAGAPGSAERTTQQQTAGGSPAPPDPGSRGLSQAAAGVAVARSGNAALDVTVAGMSPAPNDAAAPAATPGSALSPPPDDVADDASAQRPRLLQSLRVPRLSKLAVTADGAWLAGAADDRIVRVWDARTGRLSAELEGHSAAITAVSFTPDGHELASGDSSGLMKLWDLDSGRDFAALNQRGAVQFISFSRDGQWMAAGSGDESVELWKRTARNAAPSRQRALKGHKQAPIAGAFNPEASHVVTASNETAMRLWSVASDEESQRVESLGGAGELTYSTNGRWLAAAGERGLGIWNTARYEQVRQVDVRAGRHAIAFTPDGLCLVASATFRTLVLWEATSGAEISVLDTNIRVESMALTPAGDRLMVADANGDLRIWEIPAPDPAVLRGRPISESALQSDAPAADQDNAKRDKLPGVARRFVDLFR